MQFNIEILNVVSTTKPTAKGSYIMLEVAFKRLDTGKVEGKKIMSFTNKEVFNALSKATNGTQFTVDTQKNNESGFWDWISVSAVGSAPASAPATGYSAKPSGATPSPKSTYETPEERAARQVLIVRQSSLSAAVAVLKNDKKSPSTEEIIALAEQFNAYVFQAGVKLSPPEVALEDLEDDIPL